MPELPEVEVRRLYLEKTSLNRPIARVSVLDKRILDGVTPVSLGRGLKGASFTDASRRGKYVLLSTDSDKTLLVHFGMTGELLFRNRGEQKPKWSRVEFYFDGGQCLHYINMRLIGKIALFSTTDPARIPDVSRLGPEPLSRDFTFKRFREIIMGHETTIHQVLMDQRLIAGIGNIYSDEITYQAGVRPDRRTATLSDTELRKLFDKMKWVLRRSIELDAELDDRADVFIIPDRERNGVCPRSHAQLVKKTIGGRSSYFCPRCQS